MEVHYIEWYCIVLHGIGLYCMADCMLLSGIEWCFMVLYGIAWIFVVLHGIPLYCMVGMVMQGFVCF